MFVGVDGCRRGWFAVALPELGDPEMALFRDAAALWKEHRDAHLILIDVPIGLRDQGEAERLCDTEARQLLGDRASSVFPAPCREAVRAESYKEASRINNERTGRKLSKQSWGLVPKIREVDDLLLRDEKAREHIKEIHPEVCLWALAGGHPMDHHKSTEQGYLERAHVLESVFPGAYDIIANALDQWTRGDVARDDILDALAAAVTAAAGLHALASLPLTPDTDSHDLPMQMLYSPQFLEYEWTE